VPQYSAFIALPSGDYREVDGLIDAPDPQAAAQAVIDADLLPKDDDFPLVMIVEEQAVSVFTRGRQGRVASPADSIERRLRERQDGPRLHILKDESRDE
jgi:hypothetical protein